MIDLLTLKSLLEKPQRIVITAHSNPDGDAIGSSLGLYFYLRKLGHTVNVIVPTKMPDFISWLPDANQIYVYEETATFSSQFLAKAQVIFCLDYNDLSRVDDMGQEIEKSSAVKVMIDHHLHPSDFADYMLSDTSASSTCELIYDFIQSFDHLDHLDETIAQCLYTGILTDTGAFKYATSPKLFRIVAALNELGVDNTVIQDRIFNSYTEKRLRLLGYCISERLEILKKHKTGIISLSFKDYQKFNIQRGDLEGVVNYILKLKGIHVAALITERKHITKLSLRSKGDFSVEQIAANHFEGGGHKNASGGISKEKLEDTVKRFKDALSQEFVITKK